MYETYYQLKTKPFTLLPDPEFLYLGTKHKMALSLLEYGLANESTFIVITGDPGTGKTTLLNRLLDQSGHPWTIGVVSNVHSGLSGLMPWIATAFGLQTNGKSSVDIFHEFSNFLERERDAGRRVLLVLDEAQNVGAAMLEELRLLSNLNDGRRRSLQIILSGQTSLRDLLVGPGMVQLAQRIGVEYVLEGISEDEIANYIGHRLQVAGRQVSLFSSLANRVVFRLTSGIPRLVNQVCDHALVYGYAEQADWISARVVLNAAAARAQLGVLPLIVLPEEVSLSQGELDAERVERASCKNEGVQTGGELIQHAQYAVVRDPASVYREGLVLKEGGDYAQAIDLFDELVKQESWSAKALAQKGLCLKAIGQNSEALTALRAASNQQAATEEEWASVQYLLARMLEAQKHFSEAKTIYVALGRKRDRYRDVSARLTRLEDNELDFEQVEAKQNTRFASFWRGCGQLLRGMQR